MKRRAGQRFIKLVGLSANVAGKIASHSMRTMLSSSMDPDAIRSEMLREVGKELARTLGEMKGAVMKVGQIASQIKDFFPEEIAHELEALQKHAPPMSFDVIAEQIESEFGESPDTLFAEFEREPCAAASIGQVHRARLHSGERVVVKVQYPGVRESCESDLKQLKRLFKMASLLKLEEKMLNDVFEEVRCALLSELDYESEARNLLRFREYYAHDDSVLIPRFFQSHSSRCVLTLSEEVGYELKQISSLGWDEAKINAIGKRLFQLICEQLFDLRALHADPHPGNFAIQENGRIVLYDFGAVKYFPDPVVEDLKAFIYAIFSRDTQAVDQVLFRRGVRRSGSGDLPLTFYDQFVELVLLPFSEDEPFDFAGEKLHEHFMKLAAGRLREGFTYFQATRESVHIDRVFSGHYWNLVHLGVKATLREELARFAPLP